MKTTGIRGITLIKIFEGFRDKSYKCPAGVWTIGYGTTLGVTPGLKINKGIAESLLRSDLVWFEETVNEAVKVPLTQYQFDALVCFCYNIGSNAFSKSTLVKKLNRLDYEGAALQFLRWNKAGGRVFEGLTRRRKAEKNLFENVI